MHGGKSTGAPEGSANAVTHGFYSDALQPDERKIYERARCETLDDEIRLAKTKLHRFVLRAGNDTLADLVDGAIDATCKFGDDLNFGKFDRTEIKAAAPDYADLIIRQLDVIRKLELAKMQMALAKKQLDADSDDNDSTPIGFEAVPYED